MKIFLYVLLVILILLAFILHIKVSFIFHFDGNVKFTVKFLFYKYKLDFPVIYKPNDTKEDDTVYTKKEIRTEEKMGKGKKQKEKIPFPGIKNAVEFFAKSIKEIFTKNIKSFRLEKFHFKAVAAGEDAANTAELYGAFCTVGATIHHFASKARGIKKNAVYVQVTPDFLAQTPDIYSEIIFSIRVWRILFLGNNAYTIWNNYKKLAKDVETRALAENTPEEDITNSLKANN